MPSAGDGVAQRLDVIHRMTERDGFERRARRLDARQHLEFFRLERGFDGAQAVGPLGMAGRRQMQQTGGMADEERGHCNECRTGRAVAKPIICLPLRGQRRIGGEHAGPAFDHGAFERAGSDGDSFRQKTA